MKPPEISPFAQAWISAWNSHDLEETLSHYADDIVFTSPFVEKFAPGSNGTLHGKVALRPYFARALQAYPDLKFEFIREIQNEGQNGSQVILIYRSVEGLEAAEVMTINDERIIQVKVDYRPAF